MRIKIDKSWFNEVYLPYLNRNERYQIFYGGAGSGKSVFITQNLTIQLLRSKLTLLVVMREYNKMEQKVFKEFLNTFDNMKLTNKIKIRKSPLGIKFPNGSEILFMGADDPAKLLSLSGIDMVWVEEAAFITKDYFNQLELRLRGRGPKKKFFLSFNPVSATNWLKKEFFDNKVEDCFICHTTFLDNKFLDEPYKQTILSQKTRNPLYYQVFALGQWGVLGKKVFENWKAEEFDIGELTGYKKLWGMDFGFTNDPTTIVACAINMKEQKLYIYDEVYQTGLHNTDIANVLRKKGWHTQKIIADSAEPKSIAELKRLGIRRIEAAKKGPDSINQGIGFIQQFDIVIHPNCVKTIEEFENYSWKKDKDGNYINKPVDEFNHIIDALRYALEELNGEQRQKLTVLSKTAIGIY